MKKIIVFFVCVLASAFATAKADKPTSNASIVIKNPEGSTLFRLYYQSAKVQNVKVSVLGENGNKIFDETISKTDRFARAYNFKELSEGQYTIAVEDENGKTSEKVNYKTKIEKSVKISKMPNTENKFSLIVSSSKKDVVTISVFDGESNLVHSETQEINGSFAKIYNIKGMDSFSFEVTDSNGIVKSVRY
jgi:hypothetical protein